MTPLPHDAGHILLPLARQAITDALHHTPPTLPAAPGWLLQAGATCVTLRAKGTQRGRALSLEPQRALMQDLIANAVNAALNDPAHPPFTLDEWANATVEVAVLSAFENISHEDERHTIARLRSSHDGAAFFYGRHRSHFLPEMWAQHPEPGEFLAALKYRAGLPPDFWAGGSTVWRYQVQQWSECSTAQQSQ